MRLILNDGILETDPWILVGEEKCDDDAEEEEACARPNKLISKDDVVELEGDSLCEMLKGAVFEWDIIVGFETVVTESYVKQQGYRKKNRQKL